MLFAKDVQFCKCLSLQRPHLALFQYPSLLEPHCVIKINFAAKFIQQIKNCLNFKFVGGSGDKSAMQMKKKIRTVSGALLQNKNVLFFIFLL